MHLTCRFCRSELVHTFADLGVTPLSNAFLEPEELFGPERFYPLHARVCTECWLVQVPEVVPPDEIFSDYAYFSSYSDSWLVHLERYAEAMIGRFGLGPEHQVIEVASNDGCLLRHFRARGVPVLGIDPAANVAAAAEALGITTLVRFFGRAVAEELVAQGTRADLLAGNNVLAHVPDLNDFVAGLSLLLAPTGILTMEFPHLQRLVEGNQFDTIYHEHFSYLSLGTVERVFASHGLALFDVDELPTHGGSLRVFAAPAAANRPVEPRVTELRRREEALGYTRLEPYEAFAERVRVTKRRLLRHLIDARDEGRTVVGYGAPAKGNTLLNSCGIGPDLLPYTVDRSPHKQGRFLPGSRIPIHPPERIAQTRPDEVLVLPWNLADEIVDQMRHVREWGGRFVVAIPDVRLLS